MLSAVERAELAAFADIMAAVPADVAAQIGAGSQRVGEALCGVLRGAPQATELNRVAALGLAAPATDADLDAVAAFYGDAPHAVSLAPEAEPADLAARLAARGYEPGYPWVKFVRDADPDASAPTELRIEQVGANGAWHFASVVAGGFGMPPAMARWLAHLPGRPGWICLVAYDGDAPVGGGALLIDGETGWLGLGATLPEARGRGAQSAILAERIALAARAGCRTVTTETGAREPGRPERSYRNILRAGFAEAYVRPNLRRLDAVGA